MGRRAKRKRDDVRIGGRMDTIGAGDFGLATGADRPATNVAVAMERKQAASAAMHGDASTGAAAAVLAPELRAELGLEEEDDEAGGANAAVLLQGQRGAGDGPAVQTDTRPKLTAAQRRRMEKLAVKREKASKRAAILQSLQETALSSEALSLMRSSGTLGQKETQRQKLKRALKERRAGLEDTTGARLEVDRAGAETDEEEASDVEMEIDAAATKAELAARRARNKAEAARREAERAGVASEDESEDSDDSGFLNTKRARPSEPETDALDANAPRPVPKVAPKPFQPSTDVGRSWSARADAGKAPAKAAPSRPAYHVPVDRLPEVARQRMQLPVCSEEQQVMEAIGENGTTIICGETGSGKTTQVPQFLYEAGYGDPASPSPGLIGVTQPRRVAATSMARRVATELNTPFGERVAYQVRFDKNVAKTTRIKFMTDGILLKEIQSDFLLTRYSCIIVDEAHERNLYTDILIGLLSRIVPLREQLIKEGRDVFRGQRVLPLKLIIMSATLRVEDFVGNKAMFPNPPPVVSVEARQHPVTVHFNRRTALGNYALEAFKKVVRIHKRLPPGGVLIFLTGQREIEYVQRKLNDKFNAFKKRTKATRFEQLKAARAAKEKLRAERLAKGESVSDEEDEDEDEDEAVFRLDDDEGEAEEDKETLAEVKERQKKALGGDGGDGDGDDADELAAAAAADAASARLAVHGFDAPEGLAELDEAGDRGGHGDGDVEADGALEDASDASGEDEFGEDYTWDHGCDDEEAGPLHVLPLYAVMPHEQQMRVFEDPPDGHRLVVLATNVAETSITLPGIRYVVDTGRSKERVFDMRNGTSKFSVDWISKASANQRSGRAGRTGPGHVYRLYSSAVYENYFIQFSPPEILRTPIAGMILHMKSMDIKNLAKFPFPTPPDGDGLESSLRALRHLGAIDGDEAITPLGRVLASFPLDPRYALVLVMSQRYGCASYAAAIVAAMTVHDPFIREVPDGSAVQMCEDLGIDFEGDDAASESESEDESAGEEAEEDAKAAEWDLAKASKKKRNKGKERAKTKKREARAKRARKALSKRMSEVHDRWANNKSDLLALLRAFGSFMYEDERARAQFCRDNMLRMKQMNEMRQLRDQLVSIMNAHRRKGAPLVVAGERDEPPTAQHEIALCQALTAGFIDQVARRKKRSEGGASGEYEVQGREEGVFIHPTSVLYRQQPEYVCFREILRTSKPYMQKVTAVNASWLGSLAAGTPLCVYSAPLSEPPPRYVAERDQVVAYVNPKFGASGWELPAQAVEHPVVQDRVKYFVSALLEGKIVPGLAKFAKHLNGKPDWIVKSWTLAKINQIVRPCLAAGIDTRAKLEKKWAADADFLLEPYLAWIKDDAHVAVQRAWPPLDNGKASKGKGASGGGADAPASKKRRKEKKNV